VSKPSSKDRRKQLLKQRRAGERRDADQLDSAFHLGCAFEEFDDGNFAAAERLARKALNLDPSNTGALELLGEARLKARDFEGARECFATLRELTSEPAVLFNLGSALVGLGQYDAAADAMREFLAATRKLPDAHWRTYRQKATVVANLRASGLAPLPHRAPAPSPPARSKPRPEAPPAPAPTAPAAPPPPKPRRAAVDFLPTAPPVFDRPGTVADYFLRRRWTELRIAQNFEDLLCLPSLNGVDSYVFQQETVRRVLRHFKGRALLADEVGLGKTIEACLVLKEYWVRGLVKRALILTPPNLVAQWRGELGEKFGLASVTPEGAAFRADPQRFWRNEPIVVASIAMARTESNAPEVAAAPWDMVIVDEAHCLKSRATANWRLVDALQKKFILMLTATPVENNLIELYNLITLLKPGLLATEAEFKSRFVTPGKPKAPKNPAQLRALLADVMIRNTRAAADVQLPRRVAASIVVPPTDAEAQLYEMVSRFVAERYETARPHWGRRNTLDLLQRQAGSSPQALARSISRAAAAENGPGGRSELEPILDLATSIDSGAKAGRLVHMLASRPGKVVVFTEFVPTLEHLARACGEAGIHYSLFSGDLSRAEKDAAIARFRDHAQVLLSTGAGGEGRNLQFAATVINFDLPWNPMRLEQRVGRVHRIGQDHDVFVFNFCQQATVEEHLLRVLHDKVNMFELVVGEMDAILGAFDDGRDFAEIVMDLWLAGREAGPVEQSFDDLARRLIEAKKRHIQVRELDQALFARDFEA
jgi:superfamily II DNA or RNA helicase